MNWKKFDIIVIIVGLFLLTAIGLVWYLQGPQEPVYVFPPKPLLNWQTPHDHQGPGKPTPVLQKKMNKSEKGKTIGSKPMNVSLCEDNPNAPDYLSRQMARLREDNDTCAKVKLNMDF